MTRPVRTKHIAAQSISQIEKEKKKVLTLTSVTRISQKDSKMSYAMHKIEIVLCDLLVSFPCATTYVASSRPLEKSLLFLLQHYTIFRPIPLNKLTKVDRAQILKTFHKTKHDDQYYCKPSLDQC